jgi:hypothetical protein
MRVYVGEDRTYVTDTMTETQATVAGLTRRVENVRYKLYMGNFSPLLTCLMICIVRK